MATSVKEQQTKKNIIAVTINVYTRDKKPSPKNLVEDK